MSKLQTPSFRVKARTGLLGFLGNTGDGCKHTKTYIQSGETKGSSLEDSGVIMEKVLEGR